MGRVSKTVHALYGGVSQQDPGVRLDSQVSDLVDMVPTIANGLVRRSPSKYLSAPSFVHRAGWDRAHRSMHGTVHKIDRSLAERYLVFASTRSNGDSEECACCITNVTADLYGKATISKSFSLSYPTVSADGIGSKDRMYFSGNDHVELAFANDQAFGSEFTIDGWLQITDPLSGAFFKDATVFRYYQDANNYMKLFFDTAPGPSQDGPFKFEIAWTQGSTNYTKTVTFKQIPEREKWQFFQIRMLPGGVVQCALDGYNEFPVRLGREFIPDSPWEVTSSDKLVIGGSGVNDLLSSVYIQAFRVFPETALDNPLNNVSRYLPFYDDGPEISVVDVNGDEFPVVYADTDAEDYIEAATGDGGCGGNLKFETVLDTTFVVNTKVTPAMTSALSRYGLDLNSSKYTWEQSSTDTDEWYLTLATGLDADTNEDGTPDGSIDPDPKVTRPEEVQENSVEIPESTVGSLDPGEWAYGDNDGLGYDTVYIRLTDDTDPNLEDPGFIFAKPTTDVAFLVFSDASSSNKNRISVEIDGESYSRIIPGSIPSAHVMATTAHTIINSDIGGGAVATYVGTGDYSSVLRVTKETSGANVPFQISIGEHPSIRLVKKKVDKFTDLPSAANDGDILEITGEASEATGSPYWVRFDAETSRWVETMIDGISYEIDSTTMPHKMVRKQDDSSGTVTGTANQIYFEIDGIDWTDRAVGDNDTNPLPSFIGTPIADVFFYQNRLGFIAGENVILSQTAKYYNFFAQTTTEVLDDDPIDLTIGSSNSTDLVWAFPFTNSLELIGRTKQFSLHSGRTDPTLTPTSSVVDPTTSLAIAPGLKPAVIDNRLFIGVESGNYLDIYRYEVLSEGIKSTAVNITEAIPNYLENRQPVERHAQSQDNIELDVSPRGFSKVSQLIASSEENTLIVVVPGQTMAAGSALPNSIFDYGPQPAAYDPLYAFGTAHYYTYRFYEQGEELVQSAWGRSNAPLVAGEVFDGSLFGLYARAMVDHQYNEVDGYDMYLSVGHTFESTLLDPTPHVENVEYLESVSIGEIECYLDCLTPVSSASLSGTLSVTIPYRPVAYELQGRVGDQNAAVPVLIYLGAGVDYVSGNSSINVAANGTLWDVSGFIVDFDFTTDPTDDERSRLYVGWIQPGRVIPSAPYVKSNQDGVRQGNTTHLLDSIDLERLSHATVSVYSDARAADTAIQTKSFDPSADQERRQNSLKVRVGLPSEDSRVEYQSVDIKPLDIVARSWVANFLPQSRVL